MTDGFAYWIAVSVGAPILTLVFVAVNSVSNGSVFWAGCFVALLCLVGLGLSIREFRRM